MLLFYLYNKKRYKENRWDPKLLVGSGGMPSSHSSTVTALATAIGFYEGFDSSIFATAAILACVVSFSPLSHLASYARMILWHTMSRLNLSCTINLKLGIDC